MKKIRLIDFLEFFSFRYSDSDNNESTKIVRIYYPEDRDTYNKDRYFEFGIYDYSYDTRKRIIDTINSSILECYVYEIGVNCDGCLNIYVSKEEWIDDINLDFYDYPLNNNNNNNNKDTAIKKIYVCSPLRGDIETNIEKAKEYCRFIALKLDAIPVCPHIYFTRFLDDNNEIEREVGMSFGLRLLSECDNVYVFDSNGISEGMKKEIELASKLNIPVAYESSEVFKFVK